jgi:hypothetical protein
MLYLFQSKLAKIILSILWGLGLASLFRKTCLDRNCIIFRAPDPKDIVDQTFGFEKSCYQFETELTRCGNYKTVND